MKFKPLNFILWFFIYYFFIDGAIRDLILFGSTDSFEVFDSIFSLTSILTFLLFSTIAYASCHFFFLKKKWILFVLGILLAFFIPMLFRYGVEQVLCDILFDKTNYPKGYGLKRYFADNYLYGFRYVSLGLIYFFVTYSIYKQKAEKNLIIENQQMQLSMLRSQINPHFLLNSLNNLYSLVYHKSDQALDAMDRLTDILKYSLYEKKEFVTIKEELQIVKQYIALQEIRYDYPINFELLYDEKISGYKIPQFMILPLVENTFKHGDLKDLSQKSFLKIDIKENRIQIESYNLKSKKLKDEQGGVGLNNLRKRLELMYPDNYQFEIKRDSDSFNLLISIPRK